MSTMTELIERIDIELAGIQSVIDCAKAILQDEKFVELSSTMDVLRDCKAALTQQQEAEPVACEVVGRAYHESFGNGVRLKLYIDAHQWPTTEAIPIGTKLYFNPPKPAAQPQVPDEKPLPELMLASYHEAVGWNNCRKAMLSAAKEEGK